MLNTTNNPALTDSVASCACNLLDENDGSFGVDCEAPHADADNRNYPTDQDHVNKAFKKKKGLQFLSRYECA